jgi:hypothetical protein
MVPAGPARKRREGKDARPRADAGILHWPRTAGALCQVRQQALVVLTHGSTRLYGVLPGSAAGLSILGPQRITPTSARDDRAREDLTEEERREHGIEFRLQGIDQVQTWRRPCRLRAMGDAGASSDGPLGCHAERPEISRHGRGTAGSTGCEEIVEGGEASSSQLCTMLCPHPYR